MKLKSFKESDKKKIGILLFTIACVLLITGVILYKTFAIFETNNLFNVVNETIEDEGNIRFMVYVNNELQKSVPDKSSGYSLDTLESHCDNGSLVSWNDETWSVEIKGVSTTKTKCYLYFKGIYQEKILNGAIPNLGNGRLIPITISENELPSDVNYQGTSVGGKVYKADITTKWYSYTDKRWANAVILKDGETDHYKPNDEIPESVIESYFVWIPRYRYLLKENESKYNEYTELESKGIIDNNDGILNIGKSNIYQIEFVTKEKGVEQGSTKNSWLTHPAFTSFNVNGMWVGKFETGYKDARDKTSGEHNSQESDKIIIKPNVNSWRSIQVGNAFYASYGYQRELESHMMKNMEWGAVFYLTQSIYGRCTETNCENVRINNNENYVTGYSANFEPTCGYTGSIEDCNQYDENLNLEQDGTYGYSYYNSKSGKSSTTGNYYGIYDMSGGAWDYVMGVLQSSETNANPTSGRSQPYNSGFKGVYSCGIICDGTDSELTNGLEWPTSMYYDLYQFDRTNWQYQRGKLGDATKELGPFYSLQYNYGTHPDRHLSSFFANFSYFVSFYLPWFIRGGTYVHGSESGIGAFNHTYGHAEDDFTFRVVLMP